jgi:hypothetical protein
LFRTRRNRHRLPRLGAVTFRKFRRARRELNWLRSGCGRSCAPCVHRFAAKLLMRLSR